MASCTSVMSPWMACWWRMVRAAWGRSPFHLYTSSCTYTKIHFKMSKKIYVEYQLFALIVTVMRSESIYNATFRTRLNIVI